MKNRKTLFNIYILILCFNIISGIVINYCEKSLCENLGPFECIKHIACGNNGAWGPNCESSATLMKPESFKDHLVNRHNYYRNMIAGGMLSGFKPATRMATMTWDNNLAFLAKLNVKQCIIKRDDCHNTEEFKNSGQNLFLLETKSEYPIEEVIDEGLTEWFNEHESANRRQINSYYVTSKTTEHFTLMVADRNNKVGCAILKQKKNEKSGEFYMACNYATNNVWSEPVYSKGVPTTDCEYGNDPSYPSLCSIYEEYNRKKQFNDTDILL